MASIPGPQNATAGKSTLTSNTDDAAATPGKASVAGSMPTTAAGMLEIVKQHPNTSVKDGGGYEFVSVDDGSFKITKAPGDKGLGHKISPTNHAAWDLIAKKMLSELPKPAAAPAVTPATPAPVPVPYPNVPPTPPEPGLIDRAMNVVNAEIQELHERANSLWNRATSWSPFSTDDHANTGPNVGPNVGPSAAPSVAPTTAPAATPAATTTPPAATTTPKPVTPGKSLTPAGEINADTLSLGMTREGVGDTEYTLNGLPHKDWLRLKELRTKLADHAKAVKKKPKTKDPAAPLAPNELSPEDLAKFTAEKDELEEKAKDTSKVLAAQIASGKDDVTRFYCSGLSMWTLAAAGYSLTANLKGPDGNDYKGLIMKEISVNAKGKEVKAGSKDAVGTQRVVKKTEYVTLRSIVDGDPVAIEIVTKSRASGKSEVEITGTSGYQTENTDHLGGDLPLAATGAAGAFEAAGIGSKIEEMVQKPGDFAQSRRTTVDPITGVLKHCGAGHAWQVAEVKVEGFALFGRTGSPEPFPPGTKLTGWPDKAVKFVITNKTNPLLVGEHNVLEAKRLEAQDETVVDETKDTKSDGGVQVSEWKKAPDQGLARYTGYVVFYGRLSNSKWTGWNNASKESATAAAAAVDAAEAAKARNNDLDPIKQPTPTQPPAPTNVETMPQEPLQESAPATPGTLGDVTTSDTERLA